MSWFTNLLPPKIKSGVRTEKRGVPEGVWTSCSGCKEVIFREDLKDNAYVCPKCSHHMRMDAASRLKMFLDEGSAKVLKGDVRPVDMLKFRDSKRYRDRLADAQKKTGINDALLVFSGSLHELPVVAAAFEFGFIGGTMGSVVGERFTQAVDRSISTKAPLICFFASGGARMQEAMYSLLQMAKTTAAVTKLKESRVPYISVLTDPTMGGVSASLAMQGDVIIAEPNAEIGFAGIRVISQTVREELPEGFQRSEFLLRHGAIDMVVQRGELRDAIYNMLTILLSGDSAAAADAGE